jgi:signal transduction histidine kinase
MKRTALAEQPYARDALLAIALAGLVVWEILFSDVVPSATILLLGFAATLPLAVRRRAPLVTVTIVIAALLGISALDVDQEPQTTLLAMLLATYSVGAHTPSPTAFAGAAVALVGAFAMEPGDFIVLGPLLGATWGVGRLVRAYRLQAARLAELTAILEREQAENARLAIAEERGRIARELHDVVAHSVSVMVVQAGAERLALGGERRATREVLEAIERTGREALAEMRRLVGVLRRSDEEPDLSPQPSLARLDALVEHVRQAGLPVDLTVEGRPVELAPGVDVSAFRIVQEALTNSLKHAGPARATVTVRYGDRSLEIEVADDGAGGSAPNGDGHGLVGMRERIALYDGDLDAGPTPNGGFAVRARLPLERTRM